MMRDEMGAQQTQEVRAYKASMEVNWVPLSEQHAKVWERLEGHIAQYVGGNKDVPRIALVGAYRQGKTQLLFEAMKSAAQKGAVAIYTHGDVLVRLIESSVGKEGKILPSDLPTLITRTITTDLQAVLDGRETQIIHPDGIEFIKAHTATDLNEHPRILMVDELEQAYESLQQKVETSDRNPIRSLLDARDFYAILAFAPRSIYEYRLTSTLGEGEAERGRFDVLNLPPVSPRQLVNFLHIDRSRANFLWWISRGRAGHVLRAYNNSLSYQLTTEAGFLEFVQSIGPLSGVPCFDVDALFGRDGVLLPNWKDVLNLAPRAISEGIDSALSFRIDSQSSARGAKFFGGLGFAGKDALILSEYLKLMLESLSDEGSPAIIKKKDVLTLIRATYELVFEHTFDENFINIVQRKLEDLQTQGDLRFSLPDRMEESGMAESVKPAMELPFDLERIEAFFPFPMSSPQLPGITKDDVKEYLQRLGDRPLAEDQVGSVVILVFNDFNHFKTYLENQRHDFIEKSIPESRITHIILLEGNILPNLPPPASWLQKHGRLHLSRMRPSLLSEFLFNALTLLGQSIDRPRGTIWKEPQRLLEIVANDKAAVLKVQRYLAGLSDFVDSAIVGVDEPITKFIYEKKGLGFEKDLTRMAGSIGFHYPFTLAFYTEDPQGMAALSQLRSWSERSDRPLYEMLPESGGYRTAVGYLPTSEKGIARHSESVAGVRDSYSLVVDELKDLSLMLSKEEFTKLAEEEISRFLLEAFYESTRFESVRAGEKERLVEHLRQLLGIHKNILQQEATLRSTIGVGFDPALKFSPEEAQALDGLLRSVESIGLWHSAVYQRVFLTFAEQIIFSAKKKADEYQKKLNELPEYEYGELMKIQELRRMSDSFPDEAFRFLGVSRDELRNKVQETWQETSKELGAKTSGINPSNTREAYEKFKQLIELHAALSSVKGQIEYVAEKKSKLLSKRV